MPRLYALCFLVLTVLGQAQDASQPPPLPTCAESEIATALNALPPYIPSTMAEFVGVEGNRLVVGRTEYLVRGVNYYPMRAPWKRFLEQSDMAAINAELDLLQSAQLNTLRLFLWNEALFTCPGSGAVPNLNSFLRLDSIIQAAAARNFRLIITLNDLPDLKDYPLYDNPLHIRPQTRFIVERYRDEKAILAWDVRNEGDIDYGSNNPLNAQFTQEKVLTWLTIASAQLRQFDSQHLITAGWLYDNELTAPFVDVVSLHHWSSADELRQRVQSIREKTDKPILLEEFGYSTLDISEEEQARLIGENITAAQEAGLAGWMIWTAFDFPLDAACTPPACPSPDTIQHHFGLWRTDYTPKPAVEVISNS